MKKLFSIHSKIFVSALSKTFATIDFPKLPFTYILVILGGVLGEKNVTDVNVLLGVLISVSTEDTI